MVDLKVSFEKKGFSDVKTCLNSGNVAFSSNQDDTDKMPSQIEQMMKDMFELNISVYIISRDELEDVLLHAPDWWGNKDKTIYDNLIFIMKPVTFCEVFKEMGTPKDGLEQIQEYKGTIFWSFSRKDYQKTNWWLKTANSNISNSLTIRTANTVRKICGM